MRLFTFNQSYYKSNSTTSSSLVEFTGILQYFYQNVWNSVCERNFKNNFITKACQKLGFLYGYVQVDILDKNENLNYPEKKLFVCSHFKPIKNCLTDCFSFNTFYYP